MRNSKISARYAISLMDMADETGSAERIARDAQLVYSALESSRQLRKLLTNPVIRSRVKANILDEVFGSRISEDTLKFIRFVVEKNREEYLFWIMKRFIELWNEKLGVVEVAVSTAFAFNEKQENELRARLESLLDKKVHIKFEINKDVIGGFIAKVGDTLYDASVKNQLVNLKQQFLQGNTV